MGRCKAKYGIDKDAECQWITSQRCVPHSVFLFRCNNNLVKLDENRYNKKTKETNGQLFRKEPGHEDRFAARAES